MIATLTVAVVVSQTAAPAPPVPAAPPPAVAPSAVVTPAEARDAASLASAIDALRAAHPTMVAVEEIAKTPKQRPITVVTLSADPATAASRPAILVLAGMDGTRWSGTEAALVAADRLLTANADLLRDVTLYLIPRGNPDAAEAFAKGPRRDYSGDGIVHDNDRDHRKEEDPPRDLDGNGVITQLRSATAPPPWGHPTMVADPAEPRLLRAPDAKSGQLPVYTVWTEGWDTDADGLIAEDWAGGIDPERNFPHRWPESQDESGAYPLIAPESKAVADFVMGHPTIVAALALGRHDTVVSPPDGKEKTASGMPAMIDPADVAAYAEVAASWRRIVGQKRADGRDTAGSFVAWMNAQRGIPTFASTLWGRPDVPPAADAAPKAADAPAADAPKPADEEAAAWLAYSDRVRGGTGFVQWKRVQHPQIADAEAGGWVPGFRENPPLEEVGPLGTKVADFLVDLAGRRPRVAITAATAVAGAPGLWRIDATVGNPGKLPSVMRGGRAEGVMPAHVVRVSVPLAQVRSGKRSEVIRGMDPGQSAAHSWLVSAAPGEEVAIELLYNGTVVQRMAFRDGAAVTTTPATGGGK